MRGELAEELATVLGDGLLARAAVDLEVGRALKVARAGLPRRATAGHPGGCDALAIGRIHHHHARHLTRRQTLQGIAATKLDDVGHTGALRVALGKINHAVRHIAAKN